MGGGTTRKPQHQDARSECGTLKRAGMLCEIWRQHDLEVARSGSVQNWRRYYEKVGMIWRRHDLETACSGSGSIWRCADLEEVPSNIGTIRRPHNLEVTNGGQRQSAKRTPPLHSPLKWQGNLSLQVPCTSTRVCSPGTSRLRIREGGHLFREFLGRGGREGLRA